MYFWIMRVTSSSPITECARRESGPETRLPPSAERRITSRRRYSGARITVSGTPHCKLALESLIFKSVRSQFGAQTTDVYCSVIIKLNTPSYIHKCCRIIDNSIVWYSAQSGMNALCVFRIFEIQAFILRCVGRLRLKVVRGRYDRRFWRCKKKILGTGRAKTVKLSEL